MSNENFIPNAAGQSGAVLISNSSNCGMNVPPLPPFHGFPAVGNFPPPPPGFPTFTTVDQSAPPVQQHTPWFNAWNIQPAVPSFLAPAVTPVPRLASLSTIPSSAAPSTAMVTSSAGLAGEGDGGKSSKWSDEELEIMVQHLGQWARERAEFGAEGAEKFTKLRTVIRTMLPHLPKRIGKDGKEEPPRTESAAETKWKDMEKKYKQIADNEDPNLFSGRGSYWTLTKEQKAAYKLPAEFDRKLFDKMDMHLGKTSAYNAEPGLEEHEPESDDRVDEEANPAPEGDIGGMHGDSTPAAGGESAAGNNSPTTPGLNQDGINLDKPCAGSRSTSHRQQQPSPDDVSTAESPGAKTRDASDKGRSRSRASKDTPAANPSTGRKRKTHGTSATTEDSVGHAFLTGMVLKLQEMENDRERNEVARMMEQEKRNEDREKEQERRNEEREKDREKRAFEDSSKLLKKQHQLEVARQKKQFIAQEKVADILAQGLIGLGQALATVNKPKKKSSTKNKGPTTVRKEDSTNNDG